MRFLDSQDSIFQHIAVRTIVQLLESRDAQLEEHIRSSKQLLPLNRRMANSPEGSTAGSQRDMDGSDDGQGAEIEISNLAKRIQDILLDGGEAENQEQ